MFLYIRIRCSGTKLFNKRGVILKTRFRYVRLFHCRCAEEVVGEIARFPWAYDEPPQAAPSGVSSCTLIPQESRHFADHLSVNGGIEQESYLVDILFES
jgi:hypothetical protein